LFSQQGCCCCVGHNEFFVLLSKNKIEI
jgi:hypothetical protein